MRVLIRVFTLLIAACVTEARAQLLLEPPAPSVDVLRRADALHRFLEGGWSWEESSCHDDPILISASPDGAKVYHDTKAGLTSGLEVPARTRLIYRVLDAGEDRLRLSLEGESRVDASGHVVDWELVVLARERICWRRTDWPEDSCTKALIRCSSLPPHAR